MREAICTIPMEEIEKQKEFALQVQALAERPRSYHIVTYGCQMNAHDSEKLSGMMEEMGLHRAENREEADVVLFNTCCIRDNAERKALGNIIWLKEIKKLRPNMLVGVCGCMMQQKGMAEQVLKRYPFVDFAFGTGNMYQLPEILLNTLTTGKRDIRVEQQESTLAEGLPVLREEKSKAYITIMYGCNNFCSYCIVPYVRGRERSRRADDILREAERLLSDGVQEIMLLGQNVNSYGLDSSDMSFPKLLHELEKLGVPRLRFMTSHPKDLSDELIEEFKHNKALCPHLHLPVQSGSDRILSAMNRRYTVKDYMEKAQKLRAARPDIGLTTDLIVAFPGETEQDFEDTLALVGAMRYDSAFTFVYSPRAGTAAERLPGRIDPKVASERIERLIARQESMTADIFKSLVGSTQQVLVEGRARRSARQMTGKSGRNISVNFEGDTSLEGSIVPVIINGFGSNTLKGNIDPMKTKKGE